LPFGSGGHDRIASTAHLPHVSALSRPGTGPVSGQLCSAPGGRAGHTGAGFLLPFGCRPSLLGASCPARGFRPSYDRPTAPQAARTRAGFPCSARVRPGWLRVPSVPRDGGARTTGVLPGRRLPLLNGQPCRPGLQPAPGRIIDEASARVHCHSPHTSLPLTCDPGRNRVLGLSPELRTQPGRTRQRTSGRGQAWTLPGLRPWHQPASFDVLTHNVRPHVAKNRMFCVRVTFLQDESPSRAESAIRNSASQRSDYTQRLRLVRSRRARSTDLRDGAVELASAQRTSSRPREWCMAPSGRFITFSQLSIGLAV
jgi:hypothetical protein